MSLRPNCNPFIDEAETRRLFGQIYEVARKWLHVASLAGSVALSGVGNDLDIIVVPFWNDPTDDYPIRLDHNTVSTMLRTMAETVSGTLPLYNGKTLLQIRYHSDILLCQIWLPGNKVIDIKVYPGEYTRPDIRDALGQPSIRRKDILNVLCELPLFGEDGADPIFDGEWNNLARLKAERNHVDETSSELSDIAAG